MAKWALSRVGAALDAQCPALTTTRDAQRRMRGADGSDWELRTAMCEFQNDCAFCMDRMIVLGIKWL